MDVTDIIKRPWFLKGHYVTVCPYAYPHLINTIFEVDGRMGLDLVLLELEARGSQLIMEPERVNPLWVQATDTIDYRGLVLIVTSITAEPGHSGLQLNVRRINSQAKEFLSLVPSLPDEVVILNENYIPF